MYFYENFAICMQDPLVCPFRFMSLFVLLGGWLAVRPIPIFRPTRQTTITTRGWSADRWTLCWWSADRWTLCSPSYSYSSVDVNSLHFFMHGNNYLPLLDHSTFLAFVNDKIYIFCINKKTRLFKGTCCFWEQIRQLWWSLHDLTKLQ